MTNRDVTCICENATRTAAQAICGSFGDGGEGGAGTFSVPLSTSPGVTDRALATHWGMSGVILTEEVSAMEMSLDPKIWVFDHNPEGGPPQSFDEHLTMTTPRLYRIIEGL